MARLLFLLFALLAVAVGSLHLVLSAPRHAAEGQKLVSQRVEAVSRAAALSLQPHRAELLELALAAQAPELQELLVGKGRDAAKEKEGLDPARLEAFRQALVSRMPARLRSAVVVGVAKGSDTLLSGGAGAAKLDGMALSAAGSAGTVVEVAGSPHQFISFKLGDTSVLLGAPVLGDGAAERALEASGAEGLALVAGGKLMGGAGAERARAEAVALTLFDGRAEVVERAGVDELGPFKLPLFVKGGVPSFVASKTAVEGTGVEVVALVGSAGLASSLAAPQRTALLALAALSGLGLLWLVLIGRGKKSARPAAEPLPAPLAAPVVPLTSAALRTGRDEEPQTSPATSAYPSSVFTESPAGLAPASAPTGVADLDTSPAPDAAAEAPLPQVRDFTLPGGQATLSGPEAEAEMPTQAQLERPPADEATGQYVSAQQAPDAYGADQQAPEQYGSDQQAPEQYGSDQQAPEQYGSDQQGPEQYGSDQRATAQYGAVQHPSSGQYAAAAPDFAAAEGNHAPLAPDHGYRNEPGHRTEAAFPGAYPGRLQDPFAAAAGYGEEPPGPPSGYEESTRVAPIPEALLHQSQRGVTQPAMQTIPNTAPPSAPRVEAVALPGAVSGEEAHFHQIFEDFINTRAQCGEGQDGLTFEKFAQKLKKNREQLVQKYNCRTVRFQVYVKEGKAALKATPVKD